MNGYPIQQHNMRKPLANINYDYEYEMQMARLSLGISPKEWDTMKGIPIWETDGKLTKSDALILYRLKNRTEAVANDIHARDLERKAKQRGAK